MTKKIYTLRLTGDQVWTLAECYGASFTDPDSTDEAERQVSDMLSDLLGKVHRDKRTKVTL